MLRKARLLLLLVALLLALPLGLLVRRAARSAEAELTLAHLAVAERIFDEIERELSALLEREQTRPVVFYVDRLESELPRDPEPWLLGWFRTNPNGRITAFGGSGRVLHADTVMEALHSLPSAPRRPATTQDPGSTVVLETRAGKLEPREAESYGSKAVQQVQALSQLNVATKQRGEQQTRLKAESGVPPQQWSDEPRTGFDEPSPEANTQEFETGTDTREPMLGLLMDPDHLLLYRDVSQGSGAWWQGLVISVPDLLDDLSRRVISANDLDQQALLLRPGGGDAPSPWPGALRFRHRYAEPFAELESVLLLKPLPGLGGLDEILGLTLLLVVVAALGLVAVERMLAAQLGYAQRRSDFVSAVTHELKTPLTSIRMYGEMLRDGMVASEERRGQYHATITSEAERLGRLVDNVLELGRLERRDRGVQLVSADIRPLVGRTLEVLEPHAAELGFELRLQAPAELPPARHDPDALEQVVFNLVDNALKYAAASEPRRVDVELQADSEAVVLSVSDHGPGVPERQLRRIFRPFYRGERELTRRHRGTGIGLALVRGLVERIGGRVSARNREGGGLRVELRLPLV